jgi:outer membrane protein OmpA-like peptidoglycan-associated protein
MVAAMPDNQTIAVINSYTRDATGNELIALTRKQGNGWMMPQAVTVRNAGKQGRWLSLHLAPDGKTLLFATKRFDSYGGRDIYVCFRQEDGSFTEPRNLGPTINTTGNEHCPFLAADGVTLYFDTDGHPGYGGRDIFLARRLDDSWTRWSTPENLGPVFNSADSDEGFMTSAAGDFAYVVSSKDALGELDIFRIKIPEAVRPRPTALVQGRVVCAKAEEDLLVRVSQEGKELSTARLDARTRQYQLTLPGGAEYELQILGSTETYPPQKVDLRNLNSFETKILGDWSCTAVAKPEPKPEPKPQPAVSSIGLPQILFATASAELLPQAKAALDALAEDLSKNPQVQIALYGHTDYRNTASYNQTLSEQRCQAVYDYLLSKGVGAERMSKAAYGRNKPLANNSSKEGMARNRRVEILITKGLSENLRVNELGIPQLYNE